MRVLDEVHGRVPDASGSGPAVACAEDLRNLSHEQLLRLFQASSAPSSVRVVDGDPAGLGLGITFMRNGRFARWIAAYAKSPRFIWHGKSFESFSDHDGWGWNRLDRGPFLGAFPFRTFIGPSRLDGAPSLCLDFNVPKNPHGERLTWDELREATPGVLFGLSGLRIFGRYVPLAWFAVDTTRQTPSVGI